MTFSSNKISLAVCKKLFRLSRVQICSLGFIRDKSSIVIMLHSKIIVCLPIEMDHYLK
jgi:hypothetical protein